VTTSSRSNLEENLCFLASRPSRSGKQSRVVAGLDTAAPGWDSVIGTDEFKRWLLERNPLTGTDRAAMFIAMWERRDQDSLSILFRLYFEHQAGNRPRLGTQLSGSSFRVGDIIARHFEVIDKLGQGGFGEVFLVVSHEHQYFDFGALKLLRADLMDNHQTHARFEKEVHILLSLKIHPHLVAPRYIERLGNSWAIVSEYVLPDRFGRITLADHITAGKLPAEDRAKILVQVCAGLASAYNNGIAAHRDLKPSNVLIDASGRARVMDFGLASIKDDQPEQHTQKQERGPRSRQPFDLNLTQIETSFGTPAYMPPEQFLNAQGCDERSDIYSLGIVLFEMTASRLPFIARNDFREYAQLHFQASAPQLKSRFWPLIQKCLMKDPRDRFQSVRELAEAVRRTCASAGILPPSAHEPENVGRANFDDLVLRGVGFSRLGEHERAISLYREALGVMDLGVDLWCRLAFSYNALGRWDEALDAFSHTHANSRDAQQDYTLGYTYYNRSDTQGDIAAALEHFRSAAQKEPSMIGAWSMIAACERYLGRPREALKALTACVALPGARPDHWLRKARLELDVPGRLSDAASSLAMAKRSAGAMTLEQRELLKEITEQFTVQSLIKAFKTVLGAGFTDSKVHALVVGLLGAEKTGRLNQQSAVALMRSINPAVLHSQAEALHNIVVRRRDS
jgi:serine/threonine protein kinase